MVKAWQSYQDETAEFFRSLGFTASVEAVLEGARGKHKIDVLVEFTHAGVVTRWIIECKCWKSSIPKEKVLALQSITQDVGADRAFLLSEKGFQSGAVRVARNTNVALTNLEDLQANARDFALQSKLQAVVRRFAIVNKPVSEFLIGEDGRPSPPPGTSFEEVLEIAADLFMLRIGLPQAFAGQFPITLASQPHHRHGEHVASHDLAEFVSRAEEILASVEQRMDEQRTFAAEAKTRIPSIFRTFKQTVEELLTQGDIVLFERANSESARFETVQRMRQVGAAAEALRDVSGGDTSSRLRQLMRFIVEQVYSHLAQPCVSPEDWLEVCHTVIAHLDELERLAREQVVAPG
ncbi:MAG TPA: restriction endonuclease [Thermoanaerobaculia bacterium]|jgi:hypothetical protein|nr:restriction endonuclease [Thermoanaerobaculia bacterium]